DRPLPHGARAALAADARANARRAARGDPERDPRPLGHPRLRALDRLQPRAVATEMARLPADLLRGSVAGGHAAGGARADDHDHPDHGLDLSRALLARAP